MNAYGFIFLAVVLSLTIPTIPSQSYSSTVTSTVAGTKSTTQGSKPAQTRFTIFVRMVNTNSELSVTGALFWIDGSLAGSTDQLGVISTSVDYPPPDHRYRVSAVGYRPQNGTITIGPDSNGRFTLRLVPEIGSV